MVKEFILTKSEFKRIGLSKRRFMVVADKKILGQLRSSRSRVFRGKNALNRARTYARNREAEGMKDVNIDELTETKKGIIGGPSGLGGAGG